MAGTDLIRLLEGAQKSFLVYRSKYTSTVFRAVIVVTQIISPSFLQMTVTVAFVTVSLLRSASREHGTLRTLQPHCAAVLSLTCDRSFPRLCWPPCALQNASENLTLNFGVYADQFIHKSNYAPVPGCCRCMLWDFKGNETQVAADFSSAWSLYYFLGWGQRAVSSLVACTVHRLRTFITH